MRIPRAHGGPMRARLPDIVTRCARPAADSEVTRMKLRTRLLATVAAIGLGAVAAPTFAAPCTGSNSAARHDRRHRRRLASTPAFSSAPIRSQSRAATPADSAALRWRWSLLGTITGSSGSNSLDRVTFRAAPSRRSARPVRDPRSKPIREGGLRVRDAYSNNSATSCRRAGGVRIDARHFADRVDQQWRADP